MAIVNMRLQNLLAGDGDTVHRTIVSYPASQTYTPGTDITITPVVGSKESLTVDQWKAGLVQIDDTEKRQSIIALGELAAKRMMAMHNNTIEQAALAQVTSAAWSLDDGNVSGTAGNNATVNTNTVPQFFIAADTKLDAIDAPKAGRTAVVGGHFMGQLKLQQAARATVFGDGVNTRGVVANLFGWDILYSNNLPYSVLLTLDTNPTDGDTITIAGVTLTWKTTQGSTAGNINIADSAANSIINLENSINDPATTVAEATTVGFNALSAENVFLWRDKRRLAAAATSATTTTITGFGDIVVSETFAAATNVFSAHRQDSLFLVKGAIDMIVQIPPHVEVERAQKRFADNVKSLLGYGVKFYADGTRETVRVKINAGTADWI